MATQTAAPAAAPTVIPGTSREMKSAGFWIGRIEDPDKVMLTPARIAALNERIRKEQLTDDLLALPLVYDGAALRNKLAREWETFRKGRHFRPDGSPAEAEFLDAIRKEMGLEDIPANIGVRFAFITGYADQRLFPSSEAVFAKPGDIDFDELQNSSFDAGMPLAVLHQSPDGAWLYAIAPASAGWVRAGDVVFCGREQLSSYLNMPSFAVVTAPKAAIYLDSGRTAYLGYCRMGCRFPLKEQAGDSVKVLIPAKTADGNFHEKPVYISSKDISRHFLPFTQRTVLTQAFSLLNAPYGWGGANGEQDCSSFMQEIFAVCGISLPRNSAEQAKVGREAKALANAVPAMTLLCMPGHIMLYIGEVDGKPYAIHAVWAYREGSPDGDVVRLIDRVAVTPLDLGKGSRKGAWQDRITRVRVLGE